MYLASCISASIPLYTGAGVSCFLSLVNSRFTSGNVIAHVLLSIPSSLYEKCGFITPLLRFNPCNTLCILMDNGGLIRSTLYTSQLSFTTVYLKAGLLSWALNFYYFTAISCRSLSNCASPVNACIATTRELLKASSAILIASFAIAFSFSYSPPTAAP